MVSVDLHGLELSEAITEVYMTLQESRTDGDSFLEIVHGYHHGTILKSYFRSNKFIQAMRKEGYQLQPEKSTNPAVSSFTIEFI